MTPLIARSILARALDRDGQDITVRRRIGTTDTFVSVTARAFVRGYTPQELSNSVIQSDSKVIMGDEPFIVGWPGAAGGPPYPKKGDQVVIEGRVRNIESAVPVYVNGQLVRLELQVRG